MSPAPAGLSARQQAIFSYTCFAHSLQVQCDEQQTANGTLDDEGLLRRTRYLLGECPLSPLSLARGFGLNATRSESSQEGVPTPTQPNATLLFEAAVRRVVIGLQGLAGPDGNIDFRPLVASFSSGTPPSPAVVTLLRELEVFGCARDDSGQLVPVSTDFFVRCLAENAVYSCARQEAEQVARLFPDTCAP